MRQTASTSAQSKAGKSSKTPTPWKATISRRRAHGDPAGSTVQDNHSYGENTLHASQRSPRRRRSLWDHRYPLPALGSYSTSLLVAQCQSAPGWAYTVDTSRVLITILSPYQTVT